MNSVVAFIIGALYCIIGTIYFALALEDFDAFYFFISSLWYFGGFFWFLNASIKRY